MNTEMADSGCVLHLTTFLPSHGSTRQFVQIFLHTHTRACTHTHTHTKVSLLKPNTSNEKCLNLCFYIKLWGHHVGSCPNSVS